MNECPQVVEANPGTYIYFHNEVYGKDARNWQYCSANPLNFGIDSDECLVGSLPVAAPEIVFHGSQYYVAALNPGLDGIRMARLGWEHAEKSEPGAQGGG